MTRAIFAVLVAVGVQAGCCTPIDDCEVDTDCPLEEPLCDVEHGLCTFACETDDVCLKGRRCDTDRGMCVPAEATAE